MRYDTAPQYNALRERGENTVGLRIAEARSARNWSLAQLTAMLQACGVNALGLTGADINVIRSHKRPVKDGIDFGFVGDVEQADGKALATLIDNGITPVMAPLTHDGDGHMLNVYSKSKRRKKKKSMTI